MINNNLNGDTSSTIEISSKTLKKGFISITGYKHALVQIIAVSIIVNRPVMITHAPNISDTRVLLNIIRACGGSALHYNDTINLDTQSLEVAEVPEELSQQIHGSLYLIPAYLARFGHVRFRRSGGCRIGSLEDDHERPVQHLLSVLTTFGAKFEQTDDEIIGSCTNLYPAEINILDYSDNPKIPNGPLVSGATKTAILSALGIEKGETRILHPYLKPDVLELIRFIQQLGYRVSYDQKCICISYPDCITSRHYHLMSCISEIMTYIAFSIHTGVPITLTNITVDRVKEGLKAELELMERMGIALVWGNGTLSISPVSHIRNLDIEVTSTGIFSDHQPFFALMLTHAKEPSTIRERVWKDRFSYVEGLNLLGAHIQRERNAITIFPSQLHTSGQVLVANDLRSAAVLVIAALSVPGSTIVKNISHLDRGYENFLASLKQLGAQIDYV